MLGRTKQLELPRRVVVYYLLFCLFPLAWMTISTVLVSIAVSNAQQETSQLAFLGQASAVATRELSKNDPALLQVTVERFCRENSLAYAAITSNEGLFLAHTYRGRVGKAYERPMGEDLHWGEFSATRFGSGPTREYSAPLRIKEEPAGQLLLGVCEPQL